MEPQQGGGTIRPHSKEKRVRKRPVITGLVAVVGLAAGYAAANGPPKLDPALAPYKAVSGVSGNISSIGSDSLNNVMTLWAETFSKFYPNAKIQIEGKGSSTAPPALIAGTAQLGPMSREMKGTEIDAFEKKYGYKPTQIRTSVDALAVFVNKDNPMKCMSIPQGDAGFSKSRRQSYKEDIKTWGQLGLTGEWANKPISLYGRNSASGTYGFFKEHSLKNGDFKDEVKEQPGSASVVQGVTVDRFAMGYSGIGYATAGVRAVPLAEKEGSKCYEADPDNAYAGTYPLSRFLYVYVNKAPGKPLDPLTREFVKLMVSKEGQEVVIKDGYFPIPATIAKEELSKVQWVAVKSEALDAGGPETPARPLVVSKARTARRIAADRRTSRLVILGGIVIIGAILAILFVIVGEVYPLFRAATASLGGTYAARGGGASAPVSSEATGVDEYRELAYLVTPTGMLQF